jgi:ribonuclease BN (tRNA processing enzyme)
MQVTLLGTGGPLSVGRCCMGMIVTADGCQPLLIDTCGGFELPRQLSAAGFAMGDITNVVVTHRHMDHAGGMLAFILASRPVVVHALADTHEGIETMREGCFPEWAIDNPQWGHKRDRVTEVIKGGEERDIGGFRVSFYEMVHRVPTVAVRVSAGGKTLTYSADSQPCDALVDAARDADLFLCDALFPESQGESYKAQANRLMHPTARQAGAMAKAAGCRVLACVHSAANSDRAKILDEASEAFAGPTILPADLARMAV